MREFATRSLGALPGVSEMLVETLYAHGFRQARDVAEASPEVLAQIPGLDPARIPAMQEQAKKQMVDDEIELRRLEMEREQARAIEARRHPDELSPAERMMRVRGMSEKTVESLALSGYKTPEDLAKETDITKLGDVPAIGIKKARQLKSAAESYLLEEAKLRAELDAERAALGASASAPPSTEEAKAP
jgi:N utilization substance protein A